MKLLLCLLLSLPVFTKPFLSAREKKLVIVGFSTGALFSSPVRKAVKVVGKGAGKAVVKIVKSAL